MTFISPHVRKVSLSIGGVFASQSPAVIQTVLGSCVAACLFDPVTRVGGMNHFMLPNGMADAQLPTRFGVQAMERLITQLMQFGADRRRLQAKVFGGADVLPIMGKEFKIAEKNRRFIGAFLKTERIPLIAYRLGGVRPLQVYFFTDMAKVMVRPIRNLRIEQLLEQESRYRATLSQEAVKARSEQVILF